MRGSRGRAPGPRAGGPVLAGLVEQIGARRVTGWLAVRRDTPPVPVALYVNDVRVALTRAADRHRFERGSPVRTFHFAVTDLWRYCGPDDRISVRVDGTALPIHGRGLHYRPARHGESTVAELAQRLAEGWVLGQKGELALSKQLDTGWQQAVLDAYDQLRRVLADRLGYDAFLVYGSLLGLVREGGFIGHDVDLDAAYVSRHTDPAAVAQELYQIGLEFVAAGFGVGTQPTHLKVSDRSGTAVDLFHLYFDAGGRLRFPYGVAGHTEFTRERWRGTRTAQLAGRPVLVPEPAEELVAHVYGPNWRVPLPGFAWKRDRTDRDEAAHLPVGLRDELYWADHWARTDPPDDVVSDLGTTLLRRPDLPETVVDLGCGAGVDACAFAASGRRVLGLDRAATAVQRARQRAGRLGLGAQASFAVCDVGATGQLPAALAGFGGSGSDAPTLWHLNRLLDSLDAAAQDALIGDVGQLIRPGDLFAAEFATGAPAARRQPDASGQFWAGHYRRWQDGTQLARVLRERLGAQLLDDGYRVELDAELNADVELYRVLAVRR